MSRPQTDHSGGYLSTACVHGLHGYCNATLVQEPSVPGVRVKVPGRCKFCPAECICICHGTVDSPGPDVSVDPHPAV